MTSKQWMLIAVAIVLGGLSLYLNRDWFAKEDIQIFHRSNPRAGMFRRRSGDDSPSLPVAFGLNRKLKLTLLKVVAVSELETNKLPHPSWYLVSDSNSVPVNEFVYGMPIGGMRPAINGTSPETLQPGEKYRLFVQAGSLKAEHDFVPVPRNADTVR
jgi:hypothetical protein